MVDFRSIPRALLDSMCSGSAYLFVGAGFSKNATNGNKYLDSNELAEELLARVPSSLLQDPPLDDGSFMAATAAYESAYSLELLHYEICSILPEIDEPGDCHRLLMLFPWRRIYTTNYDLLLENADPARALSVEDDRQLTDNRRGSKKLVIKLCGDRNHITYMRATKERLELSSLEREIPKICEELLLHLGEAPFIFIGYNMDDNFLQLGRSFAKRKAEREQVPYPTSFLLNWNLTKEALKRFRELGLTVIDLKVYGFGPNKTVAFKDFLQAALKYCNQWDRRYIPSQQPPQPRIFGVFRSRQVTIPQPETTELEKSAYPWSDAEDVPIIVASTKGKRSQEILEQ